MAKAKVECTCKKCGKTFIREKICQNLRAAEEYEAWAKDQEWLCPDCYAAEKDAKAADGCDEVTMSYSEYKNKYADCKTKAGSYNKENKTIVVYVPRKGAEEAKVEAEAREIMAGTRKALEDAQKKAWEMGIESEKRICERLTQIYEATFKKLQGQPELIVRQKDKCDAASVARNIERLRDMVRMGKKLEDIR